MWRIWKIFDPRRSLIALFVFLFASGYRDSFHTAKHRSIQLDRRSASIDFDA